MGWILWSSETVLAENAPVFPVIFRGQNETFGITSKTGKSTLGSPDGALWVVEDANPGGLFRVTPK